MSLKNFLHHWQNLEWDQFEDILSENCEIEMIWIGMKFNKEEYFQLIKTITEEHPWNANNEVLDEINIGNTTITTLSRPFLDGGPPDVELHVYEWSNKRKIEKGCFYSNMRLDNQLARKWIKSFEKN